MASALRFERSPGFGPEALVLFAGSKDVALLGDGGSPRYRGTWFGTHGRHLASGGEDKTAMLHGVASGKWLWCFEEPHTIMVDKLVFIEEGAVLLTGAKIGGSPAAAPLT